MAQLNNEEKFLSDPPAEFDGIFRWDYLNSAFQEATGRNIQLMDIDAHVEIGGHHLMIETKDEGVPIKDGQRQALLQHWAKGYTMVIFLIGKVDPIECEIYYPGGEKQHIGTVTKKKLHDICKQWATWANDSRNSPPFFYAGNAR